MVPSLPIAEGERGAIWGKDWRLLVAPRCVVLRGLWPVSSWYPRVKTGTVCVRCKLFLPCGCCWLEGEWVAAWGVLTQPLLASSASTAARTFCRFPASEMPTFVCKKLSSRLFKSEPTSSSSLNLSVRSTNPDVRSQRHSSACDQQSNERLIVGRPRTGHAGNTGSFPRALALATRCVLPPMIAGSCCFGPGTWPRLRMGDADATPTHLSYPGRKENPIRTDKWRKSRRVVLCFTAQGQCGPPATNSYGDEYPVCTWLWIASSSRSSGTR